MKCDYDAFFSSQVYSAGGGCFRRSSGNYSFFFSSLPVRFKCFIIDSSPLRKQKESTREPAQLLIEFYGVC